MAEQHAGRFSDFERVEVLLHEYDSLRDEIQQRIAHVYQVVIICAVLATWLLGRNMDGRFWFGATFILLLIAAFGWFNGEDIKRAAAQLRAIEQHVNELSGEDLLTWETHYGGAIAGYWGRPRPKHVGRRAKKHATKAQP
ncbi:MAG TPA: hypothetical protein VE195_00940 [Acidobacteriaceae bacterium]|nr:hypothetical protein [Acidobacteriaceae bacterium]